MADNNKGIPANRVFFFDEKTGLVSREWYRFLNTIWTFSPTGTLGSMAYQNSDAVDITGGSVAAITINGVLLTSQGGTNSSASPTAGGIAYGDGASYRFTSIGSSGQFLTSNGVGAPTWSDQSIDVSSLSFGSTGLTPSAPTDGDVVVSGTLVVANGGTGVTTSTGSTNVVLSNGPTLLTPIITTTLGVGGTTPASSGIGITFPGTASLSTDVNTLDDYREGTFIPVVAGSTISGTATYSVQTGVYSKIGDIVSFNLSITLSSAHTGTGNVLITGLPFSSLSNAPCSSYIDALNVLVVGSPTAAIVSTESQIRLSIFASGAQSPLGMTGLTASSTLWISGTYAVN